MSDPATILIALAKIAPILRDIGEAVEFIKNDEPIPNDVLTRLQSDGGDLTEGLHELIERLRGEEEGE